MNTAKKLVTIAENVQKVYEAGKQAGQEDFYKKIVFYENDIFRFTLDDVNMTASIALKYDVLDEQSVDEIVIPYEYVVEGKTYLVNSTTGSERTNLPNNKLISVIIPDSVIQIGNNTFYDYRGLQRVDISDNVKVIGSNAFKDCINLIDFEIPNGVTEIGWGAFDGCKQLQSSIDIPNGVKTIEYNLFKQCNKLKGVTIPNSVTKIRAWAFYNCSSLISVIIPDSVTTIGEDVFYGCDNLESVTIPNSVTKIGNRAFAYCEKLTIVCQKGSYADEYAQANKIQVRYETM